MQGNRRQKPAGWKSKLVLLAGLLFWLPSIALSQDEDSLFRVAQQEAGKGNYTEAARISKQLFEAHPKNLDYAIYLGRVLSWKGDFEPAILILTDVSSKHPESYEALEALVNACLWSDNNDLVIEHATTGIAAFPEQSLFFLSKKAIALSNKGNDAEALLAIADILAKDPGNQEALYLRTTIFKKKKHAITLSYQNTSFSSPGMAPWHLGYLEYKHAFEKAPTVFRVNYGHLYGRSGLLYEADVYPKLSPKSYLYLNAGFASGADIFPKVRAGAEYYRNFKHSIDASLGARFLKFEGQDVAMLTGHFGYSRKQWGFGYRPFLAFINSQSYLSNGISVRRTNEVKEKYAQFDIQYGIVPYTFFFSNEINRTGTFRLGLQYQWRFGDHYFIRPFVLYEYEEYIPGEHRNRFNVQLTLSRRF